MVVPKSQQPIFEKPAEPDFIKRLKEGQTFETAREEKPLIEAPAREDELPTFIDEVAPEDMDVLREMHGLEKRVAESSTVAGPSVKIDRVGVVVLGKNTLHDKKRKRLQELRDQKDKIDELKGASLEASHLPIQLETSFDKSATAPTKSKTKRKKMTVALHLTSHEEE